MSFMYRMFVFASLCGLTLLLSGCGGGGGGSSPGVPDAPVLSLTPQSLATFHFSWPDVAGETEYRLLEDPDGASGYDPDNPVATITADSTSYDHAVFLPERINARYIIQACIADVCSDSAPVYVDGSLAEAIGYVKASNTGASDNFGVGVVLSGDGATLAVGADQEGGSGAVYVFTRNGSAWSQQGSPLKASNANAGDLFGWSLALSADGTTLAVGAYWEDSNANGINGNEGDNSATESGAVYVFVRDGGTWTQQAYVKASNTASGDWFGYSLSLADGGNTLAVGAIGEDSADSGDESNDLAQSSGAVYVFTRTGTDWSQQAYVKASNTDTGDLFGRSLALSLDGNTVAVGAVGEASNATGIDGDQTNNLAAVSGAVYVFTRTAAVWSQQAYVKASNPGANDEFGHRLALSADGNTLAVGAIQEDSGFAGIGGNQGDNSVSNSGAVYVFTRSSSDWGQQTYVKASNPGANDLFGYNLALDAAGDTLVVGARTESSGAIGIEGDQLDDSAPGSGAAYLFARNLGIWNQQAYLKASNTGAGDRLGSSVALAGDGKTLAVGAPGEDGSATGIGGASDELATDSGAVYLY